MLVEETVAEELQGKRLHALRRGRIITDDELAVDEDEEETGEEALGTGGGGGGGGEEAEVEAEEAEEVATRREVKWHLPEGLVVSPKPTKLDDKLVGSLIFMRWDAPHGWLVGKVTEMFTPATPASLQSSTTVSSGLMAGRTTSFSWTTTWAAQQLHTNRGFCSRRRSSSRKVARV